MKARLLALAALLLLPGALAETFTEDFEDYDLLISGFESQTTPDQIWYDYSEGSAVGLVSATPPAINGAQWFRLEAGTTTDVSNRRASFNLERPTTLTETTLFVEGVPHGTDGAGSQQVISLESSAPVRTMAEFFLFCADAINANGCELRIRWQASDTTGQALIDADQGLTQFKIRVVPDWLTSQYRLYVNDIDDGVFPFLQRPEDLGRLRFSQHRSDIPLNMTFDDWTVVGALNGTASAVEGDIATGIKNFATDIRFTTTGSKFFFGILLFLILAAAVFVPLVILGRDNTIVPALSFYATLLILWLIYMELWPDWIGIALIILVAALIGLLTRRVVLGINDASQGPGLVAGSLGYFIIATTLLAFSGYATAEISVPSAPVEQTADENGIIPADQSFLEATSECILSGGVVTFGLIGDCSTKTETKTWAKIKDILGWARAALNFLFQLLSFSLPIPVIFNAMIVLPPAAALGTFAVMAIRGSS